MLASAGSYAAAWRFYLPQLRADMPRAAAHVLSVGTAGALLSWGWGAAVLFLDATSPRSVRALGGAGCLAWLGLVNHFARFVARSKASIKELGQSPNGSRGAVRIAAVVVLGAGLTGDRPSPVLARRLDRALGVVRELEQRERLRVGGDSIRGDVRGGDGSGSDPACHEEPRFLIVSGGQGEDEQCTEAEAMARYLRERVRFGQGDRAECSAGDAAAVKLLGWWLVEEDRATSTEENLAYSTAKLIQLGAQQNAGAQATATEHSMIVVVTSDFHVERTRWHAQRMQHGHPSVTYQVVGAETPASARPAAYVREYAASVVQIWIPKVWQALVFPTKRNENSRRAYLGHV